jgi:hypothetical protein
MLGPAERWSAIQINNDGCWIGEEEEDLGRCEEKGREEADDKDGADGMRTTGMTVSGGGRDDESERVRASDQSACFP